MKYHGSYFVIVEAGVAAAAAAAAAANAARSVTTLALKCLFISASAILFNHFSNH
jgi:hypothetical protein